MLPAPWHSERMLQRLLSLLPAVLLAVALAATGVTSGSLLEGVKYLRGGKMTTESVVMRASSGTVRWIKGDHRTK